MTLSYFHELNNKRAHGGHTPSHMCVRACTHTQETKYALAQPSGYAVNILFKGISIKISYKLCLLHKVSRV